jgi:hypothetical protein
MKNITNSQIFWAIILFIILLAFIKITLMIFTLLFLTYILICVIDIVLKNNGYLIPIEYNLIIVFNNLVNKFL